MSHPSYIALGKYICERITLFKIHPNLAWEIYPIVNDIDSVCIGHRYINFLHLSNVSFIHFVSWQQGPPTRAIIFWISTFKQALYNYLAVLLSWRFHTSLITFPVGYSQHFEAAALKTAQKNKQNTVGDYYDFLLYLIGALTGEQQATRPNIVSLTAVINLHDCSICIFMRRDFESSLVLHTVGSQSSTA